VYVAPTITAPPSGVTSAPVGVSSPAWPWKVVPKREAPVVLHRPAAQLSPTVQLPESQAAAFAAWVQPTCGLQASSVQTLPSSQPCSLPPWQTPPVHASPVVQALPSSQARPWTWWVQPSSVLQPSKVHGLPSSQSARV
jgi:hypothetical protein